MTLEVVSLTKVDLTEANLLCDFYGPLLTDHQCHIWQLYFQENWSLAEISDLQKVSRAAVADVLDRTAHLLIDFESKLGLIAAMRQRQTQLGHLLALLQQMAPSALGVEALTVARDLALEEGLSDV